MFTVPATGEQVVPDVRVTALAHKSFAGAWAEAENEINKLVRRMVTNLRGHFTWVNLVSTDMMGLTVAILNSANLIWKIL